MDSADDLTPPTRRGAVDRCRSCRARLTAGAAWCSLCHASTVIATQPAPETDPAPLPVTALAVPGHSAERTAERTAERSAEQVAERLLAELAAGSATTTGGRGAMGRGRAAAVAATGAVGLMVLLLVGMAVLGVLL